MCESESEVNVTVTAMEIVNIMTSIDMFYLFSQLQLIMKCFEKWTMLMCLPSICKHVLLLFYPQIKYSADKRVTNLVLDKIMWYKQNIYVVSSDKICHIHGEYISIKGKVFWFTKE